MGPGYTLFCKGTEDAAVKIQYTEVEKYIQIIRENKIDVTYCESFDDTSDIWCFEQHNHDVIEMMYFRSGDGNIKVSSQIIPISHYDVIIYPALAMHKESLTPSVRQEVICIRVAVSGGLELGDPIHIKDQNQVLGMLFRRIHQDYHNPETKEQINLIEDYARLLLLTCIKAHAEAYPNRDYLDIVLEYITDHYCEKITVPGLAHLVHVSDAYLNKCFKKKTGMSIIKYVNLLRLEKGKHMMIATNYPLEYISVSVGFSSSKYFSRIFKQYTQLTPSEYRTQAGYTRRPTVDS